MLLNPADYLEQVASVGIAGRSEHPHEAIGRLFGKGGKLLEPHGGVDVVAQYDLARFDISGKQAFDAFLQQSLPEGRVSLGPGLHGLFEVTGERHSSYLGRKLLRRGRTTS